MRLRLVVLLARLLLLLPLPLPGSVRLGGATHSSSTAGIACTATISNSASSCLLSNRKTASQASFFSSASASCARWGSTFAAAATALLVHSGSRVLVLDLADSELLRERR
jgi:hypothetical protein